MLRRHGLVAALLSRIFDLVGSHNRTKLRITRKVYGLQGGIATYTGVTRCPGQAPRTSFFGSILGQHEAGPSPPSSSKRSRSPMMPRA